MKNNLFKKVIVCILIATLLISMPILNVSAYETTTDGLEYVIIADEVFIIDYKGDATKVVVPSEIDNKPVKHIDSSAFAECSKIEEIIIPEGVVTIGSDAFIRCTSLKRIVLPESINSIGSGAFRYCCALTDITLPEGLTEIKDRCFSKCSALPEINIPDTVTVIEECAFYACESLTNIIVPKNVKQLGYAVFSECINLSKITLPNDMTHIGYNLVENTAFYNNSENWEGPALYLNTYLLTSDDEMADGFVVKEGTTMLCEYSLESCENLTTIILPESLEYIDKDAFTYCYNLQSLIVPDGVKVIGETAFECCYKLKSITIPDTVTFISDSAFNLCPENLEIIGYKNSYAHKYANSMGFDFYVLDETIPYPPNVGYRVGDANLDGKINIKDATAIQKHLAGIIKFHEISLLLADVDENSDVNIKDATAIQKYLAGISF